MVTTGEGSLATRQRPRAVLAPTGDLDVANAAELQKRLVAPPLVPGAQLVLDLRGVTFLDSTGIRLILKARERALLCAAALRIVRGPEPVMRVLELVGLDDQLDIVDSI